MSPVEGLVAVNVVSIMVRQQSCDCKSEGRGMRAGA